MGTTIECNLNWTTFKWHIAITPTYLSYVDVNSGRFKVGEGDSGER